MEKGNERVAFFFYNESILSFFFIWKDLISEEYSPPPIPFHRLHFPNGAEEFKRENFKIKFKSLVLDGAIFSAYLILTHD
jgi:hypothetical protein